MKKQVTPTNLPVIRLEDIKSPTELIKYREKYLLDSIEKKMRESGRFTIDNMTTLPILARQTAQAIKKAVCRLGGIPDMYMSEAEAQQYESRFPNEFNFLQLITQLKDQGMQDSAIITRLKRDFPGK